MLHFHDHWFLWVAPCCFFILRQVAFRSLQKHVQLETSRNATRINLCSAQHDAHGRYTWIHCLFEHVSFALIVDSAVYLERLLDKRVWTAHSSGLIIHLRFFQLMIQIYNTILTNSHEMDMFHVKQEWYLHCLMALAIWWSLECLHHWSSREWFLSLFRLINICTSSRRSLKRLKPKSAAGSGDLTLNVQVHVAPSYIIAYVYFLDKVSSNFCIVGVEVSTDPKDNAITISTAKIMVESEDFDNIQVRLLAWLVWVFVFVSSMVLVVNLSLLIFEPINGVLRRELCRFLEISFSWLSAKVM